MGEILIIGVGNAFRSDDGAGPMAARRLRTESEPDVRIIEHGGEGTSLMQTWTKADDVIVIDAVQAGKPAGAVLRLEATSQPLPSQYFRCSTHAFSIAEAIELARALDQLPRRVIFFGIEAKNFVPGSSMSQEVDRAIDETVARVRSEIERLRGIHT